MNNNRTRIIAIALAAIVLVLSLFYFFNRFNTGRLRITTEAGATISVAEDRDKPFKKIGVGQADYDTNKNEAVYIRVTKGDQLTEQSTRAEKRHTKEISITLRSTQTPKRLATTKGALSHLLVGTDFVYGLNPDTRTIESASLVDQNRLFAPETFTGMTAVAKIIWENPRTFAYYSSRQGVKVQAGSSQRSLSNKRLYGLAKHPGRPLVLFGTDGLYLGEGTGVAPPSVKSLAKFSVSGAPHLFSDENHIYFATLIYSGTKDEGDVHEAERLEIKVYDYAGKKQHGYTITDKLQEVTNILDLAHTNRFLVFGETSVLTINKQTGEVVDAPFYVAGSQDVVRFQDKVFVLNKSGFWEYNPAVDAFYKISSFPRGETYVSRSLQITPTGTSVYFSTKLSREELVRPTVSSAANSVYSTNL